MRKIFFIWQYSFWIWPGVASWRMSKWVSICAFFRRKWARESWDRESSGPEPILSWRQGILVLIYVMELQEAPQEGRTWLWPQPKKLVLISELANPFPAGWWLPIGAVLRPTAAPITASPISLLARAQLLSMFLIPPMPLSLVRPVLTLKNPGTNDSALPLLTPPHHSCPAVMLPKDDHNKEKKARRGSRHRIWRVEFMFKNSLSSPSGVDEPEPNELLVWCLGRICLGRGVEGQVLAGSHNSPLKSPQTRFIKIHSRTISRLSLHFLSKRGRLGHRSRSCLRGWRDAREGLTLGGHTAVEWNTWKELFRVTKESEAKLSFSSHPRSSLHPLQAIPRSWEDNTTWIYRSGCNEKRGRR